MKNKKSIQSYKDFSIAVGVVTIALVVIALITMPIISMALSEAKYNTCCENVGDLPANSTVWLCQYLIFYDIDGEVLRLDLNNEKTWDKYDNLIVNLTGLATKEEWTIFCIDMLNRETYVDNYLIAEGFNVISCIDCEEFQRLAQIAINNGEPVKIVMYDCCCNICPYIIPVFVY